MPILYSTGPLENAIPDPAVSVALKALNNSDDESARVQWILYALDGAKRVEGTAAVRLRPRSSAFVALPVSALEYEVEALVTGRGADDTLVAVFGEDDGGNPVVIHRVLHAEMTRIESRGTGPVKDQGGDKPST
jgi:hypothetical protein